MNNNQSNENKSQNELDLGLNQADTVTPRKPVQSNESLLDKAKGLKDLFGRKEQAGTQFHVRKEPTFGESHTQQTAQPHPQSGFTESVKVTAENVEQKLESAVEKVETKVENAVESTVSATEQAKETLAAGATAAATALKRPEKWKILQILPEKHRRLFIAILALVLLLIVFFALKPNSDTVESFEQQNSNEIPVQFQSLDQSQPVETTVLDNVPAPQENAPLAENQAQTESANTAEPGKMEYVGDQKETTGSPKSTGVASSVNETVSQPIPVAPARTESVKQVERTVGNVRETVKHEAVKPVTQERKIVEKPTVKPAQTKTETARKAPVQETKAAAKNERKVQVVEAKSAVNTAKVVSSGASKTLTVPKGVSLMQVFRDNNLNISDVNAMTKANGAGNALSSFKPGDKVQVSLNGQGRVNELRLSNGAKFVRQADGSYQFKK
ncbi:MULTISPECIES: opacity-associated protein OapA [Rodentibacter]|nr:MULTISPECIES: opacity-associated protein OapA [Pasteurellaceae]NBH75352.1 acetylglucosamine transferase [Rodentibacter pneumotropicus]OOF60906.1 acetylglucosamine transferase [Rodentibacter pneumotropicus]OOF65372.1 acetylglucosamine transferase [Rodentibacter pneumotropicus]TGY48268.1 acetylglucosamine transferase [Pasteurella caecimuris]THA03970.1 acetylglucosamine transferase [Rodentibacter pneumotropicus]